MSRSSVWKRCLIIFCLLFSPLVLLAEQQWLTVNGSDEVTVSSYGFYDYDGEAVFVLVINGAKPESSFLKTKGAYRFCDTISDASRECWSIVSVVESGVLNGKKFRIGVNAFQQITKILLVN